MSLASLLVCLYFLTRIMYTSPVLWRQENFSWARNRKESQRNTMQLALWISQNLLNNSSPAAIYCKNPTSCKSSLVPVSHLTSASKKLFLLLSYKDTFSLSRSFGTIIMLRIGCPFRSLNTFNVLSRQLVRKYYFIVCSFNTGLWFIGIT